MARIICSKCEKAKPAYDYKKHSKACLACRRIMSRKWRRESSGAPTSNTINKSFVEKE